MSEAQGIRQEADEIARVKDGQYYEFLSAARQFEIWQLATCRIAGISEEE